MTQKIILPLILLFLIIFSVDAYIFSYPNSYNLYGKIYKTNSSFFKQFYNYTPRYLRDSLEINFASYPSYKYGGYTYCWNKPYGKIKITIYQNEWITEDFEGTLNILEHEMRHAYQCRVLNEYPHHNKSFYKLK